MGRTPSPWRRMMSAGVIARATRAALAAAAVAAAATPSNAATYTFDRGHTSITFSWNHLGLSRHSGRMLSLAGTLEFDPAEPEKSSLGVTLKADGVWTGVEALDKLLRSPDFLDADRFPTITFRSVSVRKTGERTGEVEGELTIMGLSKPVVLQVTWNYTGEHPLATLNPSYRDRIVSGFSATAKVVRSDWGLKRGTPLISDEIWISIETEVFAK